MSNEIGFEQIKKWLVFVASVVDSAQADRSHIKNYGRIIYNLDFNLLAPLIADAAPIGSPQLLSDHKDHYRTLLEQVRPNSQIAMGISEPTVLEVMDTLLHRQNRLKELQESASNFARKLNTELPLTETELIMQEFSEFLQTTRLPKDSKRIAESLISLLGERKLYGDLLPVGFPLPAREIQV